ncbi:hypothetical protein OQ486_16290 [Plesiomonas shigelloides]|uniref:hypothetical protein n=1 Tax=Plesiomonas shigelloides TaxID=703 RepID=UPI0022484061|nr:hypothetical protein [Plesiomonas shigelloides]MCX2535004.1 hypothetical protein [Plesiomonas shigelloides]
MFLLSVYSLGCGAADLWDIKKVYNAGDIVQWNTDIYVARGWSLGDEPKKMVVDWSAWKLIDVASIKPWVKNNIYNGGVIVEHAGNYYLSRWWNDDSTPGVDDVWLRLSLDLDMGKTDQEKIDELTSSNQIPNLERDDSLLGVDSNKDGIRDDIESFIEVNYSEDLKIKAARQFAKSMNNVFNVDSTDVLAVKKAARDNSNAISCIYSRFDPNSEYKSAMQVVQEIEAVTFNTKKRLLSYFKFNKALDGTSWAAPEGETCE